MTSVMVGDPIAAFKFYTEVLGVKEELYMPEAQLAIVVSPEDEKGVSLMLEPIGIEEARTLKTTIYEKGIPCIVFGCKDVHAEYERLSALGVKFKKEPVTNDWGTMATFDDGFGNYIQLHQDD